MQRPHGPHLRCLTQVRELQGELDRERVEVKRREADLQETLR